MPRAWCSRPSYPPVPYDLMPMPGGRVCRLMARARCILQHRWTTPTGRDAPAVRTRSSSRMAVAPCHQTLAMIRRVRLRQRSRLRVPDPAIARAHGHRIPQRLTPLVGHAVLATHCDACSVQRPRNALLSVISPPRFIALAQCTVPATAAASARAAAGVGVGEASAGAGTRFRHSAHHLCRPSRPAISDPSR